MIETDNQLAKLFFEHSGKTVDKWEQYLGIYARELAPFLAAGRKLRLLEIGVQNGGSLELWEKYLPAGSEITGIDIDPKVGELAFAGNVTAHVVDAADPDALLEILGGKTFDIIIDDGSHRSPDVIVAFKALYDRLVYGGKYIVEDMHASYWGTHEGGFRNESSAVEFFKNLVDAVNADHFREDAPAAALETLRAYGRSLACISFYDSVVVIDKLAMPKDAPFRRLLSGVESAVADPIPLLAAMPLPVIEAMRFSEPQKHRVDACLAELIGGLRQELWEARQEATKIAGLNAETGLKFEETGLKLEAAEIRAAELEVSLAEALRCASELRDEIRMLKSSTSWRMTAPMRQVVTRLRSSGRGQGGAAVDTIVPPVEAEPALAEISAQETPGFDDAAEATANGVLEPLSATPEGTTIAVVYLARSADGSVTDFEPFIASYRAHEAGLPHDLIVIRKGLKGRSGAQAALAVMLDGIAHRTVDVSDDGFDIQAYLKTAPMLGHDRVCFLNTFSEIRADGWLQKLNAPLDDPAVGVSGATGSFESLYTSWRLLSKAVWLTANNKIAYDEKIAEQFREFLVVQAPAWMGQRTTLRRQIIHGLAHLPEALTKWRAVLARLKRETVQLAASKPGDREDWETEFERHWDDITREGGVLSSIADFKPFPNPHLRSNAFMVRREQLVKLDFHLENTKAAASRFESGPDGLPARLAALGFSAVLVGIDGAYCVEDWAKSRTFRIGDQSNILVMDNQVRNFDAMAEPFKKLHARMSWGDYLPGSGDGFVDLGVKFGCAGLALGPPPLAARGAPAQAEANIIAAAGGRTRLLYSIVIPTHNRLALLRDAVGSVLRQAGDDWECVVFDNASEEPIADFVAGLDDPRVRCERSDEFLPVTASWNRAIDLARGDYVTLIGDDDGLVPGYFEKLTKIIETFNEPDFVYSSLYQFFHPMVAPWQRLGYVTDLRNGFFLEGRSLPFVLSTTAAERAVRGSLTLQRNFTFNMQAFSFSCKFLEKMRVDGKVFHSPFPDYYLANMAMGMAERIAISPEPLAVAGVSRASFGYTLFNNLEDKGAAMLNAKLREDEMYAAVETHLLPGPAYNTNYIITMAHVAAKLGSRAPTPVDYERYRRMQIFAVISAQSRLDWMRAEPGSLLWARLSGRERAWASYVGLLNWRAKAGGGRAQKLIEAINNSLNSPGFAAIQLHMVAGRFGHLPELLDALEAGTYPEAA
jgi:SAM-dependent methyltransferase